MELLQPLADWPLAAALRRSTVAYAAVNAAHILSIGLVIGAITTLDLRLLGLFKAQALGQLAPPLVRVTATGVALAVLTGALLFSVRPVAYAQNPAFLIKLGLVALGVVNAAVAHGGVHWRRALESGEVHGALKLSALFSLALWAGAVGAGRWIGFLQ